MNELRIVGCLLPLVACIVVSCGADPSKTSAKDGAPSSDGGQATASKLAAVRVHYPVGSRTLVLKGEQGPLTSAGTPLNDAKNDTWELSLGEIATPLSFVPALDGKEARGGKYTVSPGQTVDIYPHFTATNGKISALDELQSKILGNAHGIRIYLPPSYDENTVARYPVVYMHDGQIIFDGSLSDVDDVAKAYFGSWKAEKALDDGIEQGSVPEVIIVGIDLIINLLDPAKDITKVREQELTPTRDDDNPLKREGTGKGPEYLRMIAEELKPIVDSKYRTFPDREHTVIAGASLGGLISIWAGIDNGDVFGNVIAMSSSTWWQDEIAAKRVEAEKGGPKRALKIYSDTGDDESAQSSAEADAADANQVQQSERLWKGYRDAGYADDVTLRTVVARGAQHNGDFWSPRLGPALTFLLGSGH